MIKSYVTILLWIMCIGFSYANIDSLKNVIEVQHGEEKINSLVNLYDFYQTTDPHKAIEYIKEAINISENRDDINQIRTLYNKLGNVYVDLGLNFLAMDAFFSALKFAENSDDPLAVPWGLIDLGNVYYAIGNMEMAKEYFQNAVTFFERKKEQMGLAVGYNNLGLVYLGSEKYNEALEYFEKGYNLRREIGDLGILAHSNIHLSDAYLNLQQFDMAIEHLKIADELYTKENNLRSQGVVASRLGEVYIAMEQFENALTEHWKSYKIFNKIENYSWIVISSYNLARTYYLLKDYDSAIEYAHKALQKSKEHEYSAYLTMILELLADATYDKGLVTKAYNLREKLNKTTDSLNRLNDNKTFTNLQFSVETFKHRLETERLNNEIEKRNTLRNSLIIIFILILSVMGLMISRVRLKRKQERTLHIQQEEIAALEIRQKEDENDLLHRELELRDRELTSKTMGLIKNAEFIGEIVKDLQAIEAKKENKEKVQRIIDKLKHNMKEDSWDEFEIRFAKVHKAFNQKLTELHPALTPNERRLCAFLRLNMTTKEISSITYQSSKSIDVARSRLRKKMKLPREENLISYLARF